MKPSKKHTKTDSSQWYKDGPPPTEVRALPAYQPGAPVELDDKGKVVSAKGVVVGYAPYSVVISTGEIIQRADNPLFHFPPSTLPVYDTPELALEANHWWEVGEECRRFLKGDDEQMKEDVDVTKN